MSRAGAWIITVGDELLRGEIVDSNKSFLSDRLLRLDLETVCHVTVPDEEPAIRAALLQAVAMARVVIVSGGLGPTRDDITAEVAARTFDRPLVRDEEVLRGIEAFFRKLGRQMAENNAKQADFPQGAEVLANPLGTAPGFAMEIEGSVLFFAPGVPRELYRMTDEEIMPRIQAGLGGSGVVRATVLRTFGLGESTLDRELRGIGDDDPAVSLGFRTQFPDNLVRVVVRAANEVAAKQKLRTVVDEIQTRLGSWVLGEGERPLEAIVGELLLDQGRTIALAESCSGGRLASRLTDVPGSSGYLVQAVVAYANEAKVRELGVSRQDLEQFGAVSEPVACQMAAGVRERAGTDLAVATTGIAGPAGGTTDKPVGTLFIAFADADGTHARRYQLPFDRSRNKELTTQIALDWVRRRLLGLELPDALLARPLAERGDSR